MPDKWGLCWGTKKEGHLHLQGHVTDSQQAGGSASPTCDPLWTRLSPGRTLRPQSGKGRADLPAPRLCLCDFPILQHLKSPSELRL